MTILDTEPLDGVDYKNGVVGYITLVCILDFVFCFDVVFKANVSREFNERISGTGLLLTLVSDLMRSNMFPRR